MNPALNVMVAHEHIRELRPAADRARLVRSARRKRRYTARRAAR